MAKHYPKAVSTVPGLFLNPSIAKEIQDILRCFVGVSWLCLFLSQFRMFSRKPNLTVKVTAYFLWDLEGK